MNLQEIVNAISTVGFPIAACIYLVYNQREMNNATNETIDKLRDTIENNTKVVTRLEAKLDGSDD